MKLFVAEDTATHNSDLGKACNELVAFMDADDAWKPNFLTHIQNLSEQFPQACICATSAGIIRSDQYHPLPSLGVLSKVP